ncbi:MAG: class I SAM-dependent methyltransferase [Candidatus Moranbacteria bacterium]|nr:class I SAM-dependent methyltransferase [Candidatus Moranbacteria bacterium]MDD3964930.1 class I SAM-dependent methyltransferase [Candidatus Moranbacteria bacterium]
MNIKFRDLYVTKIKKYIPKRIFLFYNAFKQRLHIKFPESRLAHKYLDGLKGLEIGGSVHNPFGLDTKNVDYTVEENQYKKLEKKFTGESLKVDIVAPGDEIPLPDESQDFVLSAHVIEHFPNPIKTLKEWYRLIRKGGYIFMIVPHKERTFDKGRERTKLQELIDCYEGRIVRNPNPDDHYSVWITEDMVEIVKYLGWNIVEVQNVDDKVGNGFTIVIQK